LTKPRVKYQSSKRKLAAPTEAGFPDRPFHSLIFYDIKIYAALYNTEIAFITRNLVFQKQGLIPLQYGINQDGILYLSTDVIRITKRDPPEVSLLSEY